MKYAVINANGHVVNIIELDADAKWTPPDNHTVAQSDTASIGWTYINGNLIAPPAPVTPPPTIVQQIVALEASVTNRRFREAALGIDNGWLQNLNDQIVVLRGSPKK